jgi:hypothetical protein
MQQNSWATSNVRWFTGKTIGGLRVLLQAMFTFRAYTNSLVMSEDANSFGAVTSYSH